MAEEIKIKVSAAADNGALQDTTRELKATGQAAEETGKKLKAVGGPSPAATPQPAAARVVKSSRAAENASAAAFMASDGATGTGSTAATENAKKKQETEKQAAASARTAQQQAARDAATRTKEAREVAALEKKAAEEAAKKAIFNGRARQELLTAGRLMAEGQMPMRSIGSAASQILPAVGRTISAALGVSMGVLAGVVSGIAAVAGVAIAGISARDASNQVDKSVANRVRAERAHDKRHQDAARSWRGSAGASANEAFEAHQRGADLKDQEAELDLGKRLSIWNPMRLLGHERADGSKTLFGYKTEAQRKVDQNKEDQKRAAKEEEAAQKSAEMQWKSGEGAIELDIKRDTALHSIAGMKKRRIDKGLLSWDQEYRRIMKETNGNQKLATESANLKVGEEQKQIGLQQASGLVNARSGAGDIAQAARIASNAGALPDLQAEIVKHLAQISADGKRSVDQQSRKDYSK